MQYITENKLSYCITDLTVKLNLQNKSFYITFSRLEWHSEYKFKLNVFPFAVTIYSAQAILLKTKRKAVSGMETTKNITT